MARKESEDKAQQIFTVKTDDLVEQVIIAAALVSKEARKKLAKILPDRSKFHTPMFAACWAYVLELDKKGLDHEPALMSRMVGQYVDVEYVDKLLDNCGDAPPSDLDRYIKHLFWDDVRVRAAKGPASLFAECLANPAEEPERLKAIVKQLAAMFDGVVGGGRFLVDGDELVNRQMADLEERIAGRMSYPFGLQALDFYEEDHQDTKTGARLGGQPRMLPGAKPKLITLVAASTGVGKSSFGANVALGQVILGKKVLYGAFEPEEGMTLEKIAGIYLKWSLSRLLKGRSQEDPDPRAPMSEKEKTLFRKIIDRLSKKIIFMSNPFFKATKPTNESHLDLFQEHIETSGADFVIADMFERLLVEDRPDQQAHALRRQQSMMKECRRAHLMILAHFNKQSGAEVPTLASITGSAAWSQIPNNVVGLDRQGLRKNVEDNTIDLHVLKQRDGVFPQLVECEWSGDSGAITGGKSLPYEPPIKVEGGGVGDIFGGGRKKKN